MNVTINEWGQINDFGVLGIRGPLPSYGQGAVNTEVEWAAERYRVVSVSSVIHTRTNGDSNYVHASIEPA